MLELISRRRPSATASTSDGRRNPPFPVFLLPALRIPFPRWRVPEPVSPKHNDNGHNDEGGDNANEIENDDVPSLSSSPTSPTTPVHTLPARRRLFSTTASSATLRCRDCAADLAFLAQIISKGFVGRHGPGYLVAPPPAQPTPSCPRSPPTTTATTAPENHGAARGRSSNSNNDNDSNDSDSTGDLVNIRVGRPESRRLITGPHVVADARCAVCGALVGWKYLAATDAAQRYKVGKFVLEASRVVGCHRWEDVVESVPLPGSEERKQEGQDVAGAGVEVEEEERVMRGVDDGVIVFNSEDEDECEEMFAGVWNAKVVASRRRSKVGSMSSDGDVI